MAKVTQKKLSDSKPRLTAKQQVFINEYVVCLNATEAARRAGYKGSLRVIGHENLTKPYIRSEIDKLLAERTMKAVEVLARLADHASASMEDFITVNEFSRQPEIDFYKAEQLGKLHLIKKIKYGRNGFVESIELHNPQTALVHLGKAYALFTDKFEITWRDRAIDDIKAGRIRFEQLVVKDKELAHELFRLAGVPVDDTA